MSIIQTSNLVKKFGRVTALDGVDLNIAQGQVHAFLGPNGAGKSTTIGCLLGILRATSGDVKLFGKDAWKSSVELHKRLSYVPGDVNLWGNMTGGEVIDLFLSLRGQKPNMELRNTYLERFELDPTKKCQTYSKGNRQKVSLVAAFAADPELYIFDEPTSGLDPLIEKVFQDCVSDVKKQGKTVFLSSHILSEVEKLADNVSIIKEGKIILSGAMKDVVEKGRNLEELFLSEYEGRA